MATHDFRAAGARSSREIWFRPSGAAAAHTARKPAQSLCLLPDRGDSGARGGFVNAHLSQAGEHDGNSLSLAFSHIYINIYVLLRAISHKSARQLQNP